MTRHEGTAFVALLRACAKNKDLYTGTRIHNDVLKRGLLDMCLDPLVTMYAKCGELASAKNLLCLHKSRSVFSWTALIAGYAHKGHGHDALNCFEQMQHEGLSPDAVTFACTLKACGSIRAHEKGEQIHDEIVRQGLLGNDIVLGNALVDMYVKCGAFAKARRVLGELPVRDVVSWSALIAGYAQQGQADQAMECFKLMQREGLSPDAVTFVCMLKACGSIGAADKGEQIHDEIAKQRLLESNIVLGNALVDMYAKCGEFVKAQSVLEELPVQNVVSWNALISGYVQKGQAEQAFQCFERMQHEGLSPNAVTFLCILKACGSIGAVDKGEKIHDEISKKGLLESNIELGNAVVDMYIKCGALAKAQQVLEEELPIRNVVSWSTLISGYAQQGQGDQALRCFEQMQREGLFPNAVTFLCILKACGSIGATDRGEQIHDEIARQGLLENDVVLGTALVDMYAKCGALEKAQHVLEELPVQNVVSWNALIAGYVQKGQAEQALDRFECMQHEGLSPDSVTFLCILKACGSIGAADKGEHIHDEIARQGLLANDIVLGNALVDMYAKCGALEKALQVLEGLCVRDVVSWSALIQGYAQHSQGEQAIDCFERMQCEGISPNAVTFLCILKACGSIGAVDKGEQIHYKIARQGLLENDIAVGTALVDMYCKWGALKKAQGVLEKLPVRNVVSWTALITGYVQQGQAEQALNCFEWMQCEGLSPDAVTFLSILKVCGSVGLADKGQQIYDEIAKQGLGHDLMLGNALVDMYVKCGALAKAQQVLEELPVRDAISWSALIAGYAQQGQADEALNCFERMQGEGFHPDAMTFACLLKACGSVGAADKGEQIHDEISRQGLLVNNEVLGNALVNMYAKCGALAKVLRVLEELPSQNVASWNALIAGYAQHGQGEQALECFEGMQRAGFSPDGMTLLNVLKACGIIGLVDKARVLFVNMSTKHGIKPDLEHYTCMVDVYGRAGQLDKAVEVIQKMPSLECSMTLWYALLGACRKWGDVNVGRWAFEHAVQVDRNDAAAYVLMANIYASAGMQEDAENIEAMKVENEIRKKPAASGWTDTSENGFGACTKQV